MRNTSSKQREEQCVKVKLWGEVGIFPHRAKTQINKIKRTYAVRRNVCQCHWRQEPRILAALWEKWSICWPGSCDLPCHSATTFEVLSAQTSVCTFVSKVLVNITFIKNVTEVLSFIHIAVIKIGLQSPSILYHVWSFVIISYCGALCLKIPTSN